jgi:alkylation response protein AidB-like acyl-CoA dehydrogenase
VPVDASWDSAVHAGQAALAYELIGASRQMLSLAREHALSRIQGGRVIAKFQAVRHRLAETIIAIEGAAAAADAYWINNDPMAAPIAKAVAGQASRTTARHAQQVLAGMGFTAEHAFHHYFKRTRLLDQLFGSAQLLTRELGEQIIATKQLPAFLPL